MTVLLHAHTHNTNSERKIDQIEDRLAGIEQLLRDLKTANSLRRGSDLAFHEPPPPELSPSTAAGGDEAGTAYDGDGLDSAFEGSSSLAAHTVFASEFLEHAVERTSLRDLHPSMAAALGSLKQIVGMQNSRGSRPHEVRFVNQKSLPKGGFRELPMPPVAAVIPILREIKGGSFLLRSGAL